MFLQVEYCLKGVDLKTSTAAAKKAMTTSLENVRKAISHRASDTLQVSDYVAAVVAAASGA